MRVLFACLTAALLYGGIYLIIKIGLEIYPKTKKQAEYKTWFKAGRILYYVLAVSTYITLASYLLGWIETY